MTSCRRHHQEIKGRLFLKQVLFVNPPDHLFDAGSPHFQVANGIALRQRDSFQETRPIVNSNPYCL